MKTFISGIGPVDDTIAPGQPGGPPATVATGASGAVPVDPGQSTALPSTDPTAAPPPLTDNLVPSDPTNAVDGIV